jgi:hypothetical protein
MPHSTAFSTRHERVAAYVEAHSANTEAEADRAGADVNQALAQRSAARRAQNVADESEATLAAARFWVARSRQDRAVADLEIVRAQQRKVRAAAAEFAWSLEVTAIEQGNPHDPHSPEGYAWMAGYGDALHNPDLADVSGDGLQKLFGDNVQHFLAGRAAGARARH